LRTSYPAYYMAKQKVELTPDMDVDAILEAIKEKFKDQEITAIDGVKIDFPDKWVHLRNRIRNLLFGFIPKPDRLKKPKI